jgi:hypothetical protein
MKPTVTGDTIIVPNAASSPSSGGNVIPWQPSFGVRRYMQFLGASELGSTARKINTFGFRYYTTGTFTATYTNLKIYMMHKSTSGLSSTFSANYGTDRTLVLSKSSYTYTKTTTAQDFTMIPFDTSFSYNGNDNIVFEVVYTGGTNSGTIGMNVYSSSALMRLYAYTATATTGSTTTNYGIVTMLGFQPATLPPSTQPWQAYSHRYRDDPKTTDDIFTATIHVYDDDEGEGTYDIKVKVNNIDPVITPRYVMPQIRGYESGTPSILLPQVPFDDPATQYDTSDPNEVWTYWFDMDNNGMMNNAPDVIGTVEQSDVTEIGNKSYGQTPADVYALVNDDYVNMPIACYIFDDDMELDPSAGPSGTKGTVSVYGKAPVVTLEAYIPMEVRVRMSGTKENDLRVQVLQKNPKNPMDVLRDEMTIERMPGQPKENPFSDGTPSAPLLVKVEPWRNLELAVTLDATADMNDVHTESGPNGADPVYVYLDFPMEDDYDPNDEDQSSTKGHHWVGEYKFNVQQDGPISTQTTDISSAVGNKKAYLVGTSYDDASDDARFHWQILSGSAPVPTTPITHYNDGSPSVPNGAFKDTYPSPWTGTAPVTYSEMYLFSYTGGFSIALYTYDDDGLKSNTASLTVL